MNTAQPTRWLPRTNAGCESPQARQHCTYSLTLYLICAPTCALHDVRACATPSNSCCTARSKTPSIDRRGPCRGGPTTVEASMWTCHGNNDESLPSTALRGVHFLAGDIAWLQRVDRGDKCQHGRSVHYTCWRGPTNVLRVGRVLIYGYYVEQVAMLRVCKRVCSHVKYLPYLWWPTTPWVMEPNKIDRQTITLHTMPTGSDNSPSDLLTQSTMWYHIVQLSTMLYMMYRA